MASALSTPPSPPYGIHQKQFQKWVFLFVWPLINTLFAASILFDLGKFDFQLFVVVVVKLWIVFGLSFLVIQLLGSYFSKLVPTNCFWRQLGLHVFIIVGIASFFAPVFTLPSAMQYPQTLIISRAVVIMEIIIYLIVLQVLNQQERSYASALALRETELNMLRFQSNPHFLFNTLNLITAEISSNPDNAKEIVFDLADLPRSNIRMAQQRFTTVYEELKLVTLYLTLQQKRFKDRLTFDIELDPETKNRQIPALLLQPVVENTVKYAVAPYASKAHINVEIRLLRDKLSIVFKDTGPPFDSSQIVEGNGFRILRKTLDLNYSGGYEIHLRSTPTGGIFTICLPTSSDRLKNE